MELQFGHRLQAEERILTKICVGHAAARCGFERELWLHILPLTNLFGCTAEGKIAYDRGYCSHGHHSR